MDRLINCWVGQKFQLRVDDRYQRISYIEYKQTQTTTAEFEFALYRIVERGLYGVVDYRRRLSSAFFLGGVRVGQSQDYSLLVVPASMQDHVQGTLSAAVVLVMYGDYQSSQSADVYKLVKVIRQQMRVASGENDICFVFRHFPQKQLHPHAQRAAQSAEAAAAQGQFWSMHNALFAHQQELRNGYLVEYANNLGLNIPQFLQELPKQAHIDRINEDIEGGIQSGVTTAPALFINGIRYAGRWNMTELTAAIIAASN